MFLLTHADHRYGGGAPDASLSFKLQTGTVMNVLNLHPSNLRRIKDCLSREPAPFFMLEAPVSQAAI